jgi:hypothetical protein
VGRTAPTSSKSMSAVIAFFIEEKFHLPEEVKQ